jgi:hypothetical protein
MNKVTSHGTVATAEKSVYNTKAKWAAAHRGAARLAKRMGRGWTGELWENLGWHYLVRSPCGRITIHPHIYKGRNDGYSAFLNRKGETGGIWAVGGKTPRAAVEATIAAAKKDVAFYQSLVAGL